MQQATPRKNNNTTATNSGLSKVYDFEAYLLLLLSPTTDLAYENTHVAISVSL